MPFGYQFFSFPVLDTLFVPGQLLNILIAND